MSSLPRWWPYRITLEEAGRRLVVLLAGVIVGANAVTHYYKPLQVGCFIHFALRCKTFREISLFLYLPLFRSM